MPWSYPMRACDRTLPPGIAPLTSFPAHKLALESQKLVLCQYAALYSIVMYVCVYVPEVTVCGPGTVWVLEGRAQVW